MAREFKKQNSKQNKEWNEKNSLPNNKCCGSDYEYVFAVMSRYVSICLVFVAMAKKKMKKKRNIIIKTHLYLPIHQHTRMRHFRAIFIYNLIFIYVNFYPYFSIAVNAIRIIIFRSYIVRFENGLKIFDSKSFKNTKWHDSNG